MFNVYETTDMPYRRPLLATRESLEEAKAYILAIDPMAFMEDDADNAGCADAYLPKSGRLMAVEPEGFKLDSNPFVCKVREDAKAHASTMQHAAALFDMEFLN